MEKTQKHTPGPWHVGSGKHDFIVYDAEGWAVASAAVYHQRNQGCEASNARLIASAPDLLAALEMLWDVARDVPSVKNREQLATTVRAALRAAKGG